jgi:hypothetical protein
MVNVCSSSRTKHLRCTVGGAVLRDSVRLIGELALLSSSIRPRVVAYSLPPSGCADGKIACGLPKPKPSCADGKVACGLPKPKPSCADGKVACGLPKPKPSCADGKVACGLPKPSGSFCADGKVACVLLKSNGRRIGKVALSGELCGKDVLVWLLRRPRPPIGAGPSLKGSFGRGLVS